MSEYLIDRGQSCIPIKKVMGIYNLEKWLVDQEQRVVNWVNASGFKAEKGKICLIADKTGKVELVLCGTGEDNLVNLWTWAAFHDSLPEGTYSIVDELTEEEANHAAIGWGLASYDFNRYFSNRKNKLGSYLIWPASCDRGHVTRTIKATYLVRDLINTPASDMGPEQLAEAVNVVARDYSALVNIIIGDKLLAENFPAIHAVGRASINSPRLIDLRWGNETNPKVTLVGKGVCFDTGGLDIKGSANMKLMKKDMGGAAHVLGLAQMVMAAELPVRLRVLIPAVENSISGNAIRPSDIIIMRNGLSVEIGNTDAEGRLILADALAAACEERPDVLLDLATLTGAARVALGTELPALFSNDDELAVNLKKLAESETDPLWRLPLWKPYKRMIAGKVADLSNAPESGFGGAITAALFLQSFVLDSISWAHVDLMAWNMSSRPGQQEGGEAMTLRTIFAFLRQRFG